MNNLLVSFPSIVPNKRAAEKMQADIASPITILPNKVLDIVFAYVAKTLCPALFAELSSKSACGCLVPLANTSTASLSIVESHPLRAILPRPTSLDLPLQSGLMPIPNSLPIPVAVASVEHKKRPHHPHTAPKGPPVEYSDSRTSEPLVVQEGACS